MTSLVVFGDRVLTGGRLRPAAVHIADGRIASIEKPDARPPGVPAIDAGSRVVFPGLVDAHVHVNEPGRTEWEGIESATRAAAAGGVTTIVDMPLNSVPATVTVAGLRAKREATAGRAFVDVAHWGGVVPGNAGELEPLAAEGVRGFKCFLAPSGVDEFGHVGESDLRQALPALARTGLPLLVHAERPDLLRTCAADADPRAYATWLAMRPPESEREAIALVAQLAIEFGVRIHIVHLSSPQSLTVIREARARGARLTVETCPHYLTFAAEDIADGATASKCAPPIRTRADREGLWRALADGDLDFIASDHSPAPPELKHLEDGDFLRAWGGIASLQVQLAAVWTGAAARAIPLERLGTWLAAAPAQLAGLDPRKGSIEVGHDADLVIWDDEAEAEIDPATLHHRHRVTPYAGMRLRGRVETTILRGEVVCRDGEIVGRPQGRMVGGSGLGTRGSGLGELGTVNWEPGVSDR